MQRRTLADALVVVGGALVMSVAIQAQEVPVQGQPTAAPPAQTASEGNLPPAEKDLSAPRQPEEIGISQVRIVRLSQVRGTAQLDRNTGRGFEQAFANIPVIAGAKLRTGQGVAEVEFEDNSSLRLTPESEVVFRQLARSAAGVTETTVQVTKGVVYVALEKTKAAQFTLLDQSARIDLQPGTHLRLKSGEPQAELAVFDGSAQLQVGSSVTTVGKKQTLELAPATFAVAAIQKGVPEADWDEWDKQESGYHKQVASFAGNGGDWRFTAPMI